MLHRILTIGLLIGGLAATGCVATASGGAPAGPAATLGQARGSLTPGAIESLTLSFRDPATRTEIRIAGPYRVLRATGSAIELEPTGPGLHRSARVRLFAVADALWALARVDGREFLARVH